MTCVKVPSQDCGNIKVSVLNYFFPCISTNLSGRLGFDNLIYHNSFMSLEQMKDYMYTIIDDDNVTSKSSYTLYIS